MSELSLNSSFVAIDFETALPSPDSACAVGLVKVEAGHIVARTARLIRPPRAEFSFTHIHGITWDMVERERDFGAIWPELREFIGEAEYLVAHNAPFDRGVLTACLALYDLHARLPEFVCTVRMARRVFGIYPTTLPDCCRRLGIALNHHDAASDAEAAALIAIAALRST